MTQRRSLPNRLHAAPLFAGLALALVVDRHATAASATNPPAIVVTNCHDGGAGSLRAAVLVASEAGTAKIPAPTTTLTMLAARAHGPTARTSPASRVLSPTAAR